MLHGQADLVHSVALAKIANALAVLWLIQDPNQLCREILAKVTCTCTVHVRVYKCISYSHYLMLKVILNSRFLLIASLSLML